MLQDCSRLGVSTRGLLQAQELRLEGTPRFLAIGQVSALPTIRVLSPFPARSGPLRRVCTPLLQLVLLAARRRDATDERASGFAAGGTSFFWEYDPV